MIKRLYNYNLTEITDIAAETKYLWVAFKSDGDYCYLKKVSGNNPLQVYFSLSLDVAKITRLQTNASSVFLAIDDTVLIGQIYGLNNPLTIITDINRPIGITEPPIDMIVTTSFIYFLLPGELSGTNAKILKYSLVGVYIETIELTTVNNAHSFVSDGTDFWVITNSAPTDLIRVYNDGIWNYTVFNG
jgi:hypothetical protein